MQQHGGTSLLGAGGCDVPEGERAFLKVRNSQKPGAMAAFAASSSEDSGALSIVWAFVGGATVAGKVGCLSWGQF